MDWTWLDCIHISFTYIIYYHTRFSQICWILEDSATWKTHSGFSVCFVSDDWNPPHWIEICRGEKTDITCTFMHMHMYIYIYTWNYIYLRVYIYYKIYLIFTIYTLYSIHPYWKQSRKLEAPDRTWWSLKVEEKILGDQGANLWGNCRGNHDFMFVVFVWFWGGKSQGWSIFAPIGCPCFSFVFVFFVLQ